MASGNEERIDSYIDLRAIGEETDAMKKQLNEVLGMIRSVNDAKKGLGKVETSFDASKIKQNLTSELEKMAASAKKVDDLFKNSTGTKALADRLKELGGALLQNEVHLQSLGKFKGALQSAFDAGAISADEFAKHLIDIQNQEVDLGISSAKLEDAIDAIRKQTEQAGGALKQLGADAKTAGSEMEQGLTGQGDLLGDIVRNELRLKELARERAALQKQGGEGNIERLKEIAEETAKLKGAQQQLSLTLKNQVRELNTEEGSLNNLRAQLILAQQAFDNMSEAERNAGGGKELLAKIKELDDAVKILEFSSGRFQRNVGNYEGSAKIIVDALKDVEDEMTALIAKQQELQAKTSGGIGAPPDSGSVTLTPAEGGTTPTFVSTKPDPADVQALADLTDQIAKLTERQKELQKTTSGFDLGDAITPDPKDSAELNQINEELAVLLQQQTELQQKTQGKADIIQLDPKDAQELEKINQEIADLAKQREALKNITDNKKFLNLAAGVGDARAEIAFFSKQLSDLAAAGVKDGEVVEALKERIALLTRELKNQKGEIRALASETRGLDLFAQSVTFIADAFEVAAGASALFGKSQEQVEHTIKKLIAIQSVANGVRRIAKDLMERETAAGKIYAFVQGLIATSLNKSATAAQRFKAALGIFAIAATIIGALIIVLSEFNKKLSESEKQRKLLNDVNEKAIEGYAAEVSKLEVVRRQLTDLNLSQEERIRVANEYNKTAEEGNKIDTKQINNIDLINAAIDRNIAKIKERALAQAASNVTTEAGTKVFQAIQKVNELNGGIIVDLANIDFQIEAIRKKVNENGISDLMIIKLRQLLNALKAVKEANEEFNRSAKLTASLPGSVPEGPAASPALPPVDTSSIIQRNKRAQLELFKLAQQQEIELQQEVLSFMLSTADQKVEALKSITNRENSILAAQASFEINEGKKTAEQIIAIRERANKQMEENNLKLRPADAARDNAIIQQQADFDIAQAQKTADEKRLIVEQTNDKIRKNNEKLSKDISDLRINDQQKQRDELKRQLAELDAISAALKARADEEHQKTLEDERKKFEDRLRFIEISTGHELELLNDKYAKGKISKEKFEKEKKLIELQAIAETLDAQLKYYETILGLQEKVLDAKSEELAKLRAEIQKIKTEIAQTGVTTKENDDKNDLTELQKFEKTLQDILNVYNQIADVVGKIADIGITRQKNEIEEQMRLIDEKTAKEIESINQTTANKVDAEAKISIAEKRAAAQKQVLDNRQKQLDVQKAKFDKAANIGRIAIEGALAVTKALQIQPIPLMAVIVGALAAAQLAVAVATPIPQFKEGKRVNDDYAGPAIVGDGGRSELIQREDGSMEVTPAKPTMTWVEKQDIIHPDAKKALQKMDGKNMEKISDKTLHDKTDDKSSSTEKQISKITDQTQFSDRLDTLSATSELKDEKQTDTINSDFADRISTSSKDVTSENDKDKFTSQSESVSTNKVNSESEADTTIHRDNAMSTSEVNRLELKDMVNNKESDKSNDQFTDRLKEVIGSEKSTEMATEKSVDKSDVNTTEKSSLNVADKSSEISGMDSFETEKSDSKTTNELNAKAIKESLLYDINTYHNLLSREAKTDSQFRAMQQLKDLRNEVAAIIISSSTDDINSDRSILTESSDTTLAGQDRTTISNIAANQISDITDSSSDRNITERNKESLKLLLPGYVSDALRYYDRITSIISSIKADDEPATIIERESISKAVAPALEKTLQKAIIVPSAESNILKTMKITDKYSQSNQVVNNNTDQSEVTEELSVIGRKLDTLNKTIKNKTENHIHIEAPLKTYIRKSGDSWQERLNP